MTEPIIAQDAPPSDLAAIRVVPLVPLYEDWMEDSRDSLDSICKYAQQQGVFVYRPCTRRASAIHVNRNEILARLIESGYPFTHVFWWDSDMIAPEDTLVRLLNHKVDIVAALCTTRSEPPLPNARMWDSNTKRWEELWQWPNELMSLDGGGIGTAVTLHSLHALQQVAEVYLQCLYERDVWRMPKKLVKTVSEARLKLFDKHPNAHWFRWLPPADGAGENGEDMTFCWLAQRYAGLKVYVDPTINPGHIGKYAYSIKDFIVHRDRVMEQAAAEGRLTIREKSHLNPIENAGKQLIEIHRRMVCAANGHDFSMPKVDQQFVETGKISVLIPSRGRKELLEKSIESLLSNATGELEVLVRLDDDDPVELSMNGNSSRVFVAKGARFGYRLLHEYYNEMAAKATGDWLVLWNDDAVMETHGWDEKIRAVGGGLKVLNATGPLNLFPIFTKKLYDLLGHVSLQTHCDSWLQVVSRMNGIEQPVDIRINHLRETIDDERKSESLAAYSVTSPEFYARQYQAKLYEDVKKVKEALVQ